MKKNCQICQKTIFKTVFKNDKYFIRQCQGCKFAYLENNLSQKELEKIYSQDYFNDKKTQDYIADAQIKFNYLKKYIPIGSKILDFGCGVGDFIGICKKNRLEVCGYDISSYAAKFVLEKYQTKVLTDKLRRDLFEEKSFDVIVLFDVIEHMSNIDEVLSLFSFWLKSGGLLIITTPNIKSWDAKLLGKHWYGYKKIPQHISYFSPDSVNLLLKKHGFSTEKVKQWGFSRSLIFVLDHLGLNQTVAQVVKLLLDKLGLSKINIFFPVIDMMITAKKK
jgi:2-polyprenyl-3-methyl-5-hydroxy-6-metoxy-1,4-benzoquinol methylase